MYGFGAELATGLAELREAGLYKVEGRLASPQSREITVAGKRVINMCANNYLGLADHPVVVEAARTALLE
ncbi:MAG TPA: glycine C-acetyltransferase, partial [Propionibacteriaceae bacterium]|nr:glycine C-acetyltransferase [Propionibacteriaceae bacterium]